jgi:lipopolysaccharide transport system ATP-binding protein
MTDVAVQVENLSKLYYIAHLQRKQSARQMLAKAVTTPFRRAAQLLSGHAAATSDMDEPLWALKDVSFEVKRGEVLGIIGRNGAGKSTLLKILSRITEPTSGRAVVHGRMGSLLEVGTGFHPDLTGRENVFLNGTMLGMTRAEVARKFDEIVAFAEIERFIDTPVKNYSSGMYTRLAFAVAAHLEPEILVCDEVLAVGDLAFQNKCLGKMGEVSKHGRTVLFVITWEQSPGCAPAPCGWSKGNCANPGGLARWSASTCDSLMRGNRTTPTAHSPPVSSF